MPRLPNLFSPLMLRSIKVKNRIASTGHSTGLTESGLVDDKLLAYYEARARGGVGLIVTGSTSVHRTSTSKLRPALTNWDDSVIPGYRRLARAAHQHGATVFVQLNHAGGQSGGTADGGPPVAPSPFHFATAHEAPYILDIPDIEAIVAAFAAAAVRVRAGDLDGVEIHAGHGNLIQQFLSPRTNLRTDPYGGSEARRLRFALDVLRAVRSAVGPDFVVGLRYSLEEDVAGGLTQAMSANILPALVDAGELDYVSVTSGIDYDPASLPGHYASMYAKSQHMRHLARAARKMVSVPLIAAGRVTDPRDAEDIVSSGDADLVGMTRALIADRDLPRKAQSGDLDLIRYCIGANEGCLGRLFRGLPITCIQDPISGREATLGDVLPASDPLKVVVVGAGVAGMEAARVAALRGHSVTLLERDHDVGGQLRWARMAPGREGIGVVSDQHLASITRLGVTIRLGVEADVQTIQALEPNAVIVATGYDPVLPDLVDEYDRLISVQAAFDGARIGESAAVFDIRGDIIGATTADWLAQSGRSTWLITPHRCAGHRIEPMTWRSLHERLSAKGVSIIENHEVVRLTDQGIDIRDVVCGRERSLQDVATVICSTVGQGRTALFRDLKADAPELAVTLVGDAVAPRDIEKAIYEAHLAARVI